MNTRKINKLKKQREKYNEAYKQYCDTWKNHWQISPSFLEYLRDKRDEAGKRKNWKAYENYSDLIQEENGDGIFNSYTDYEQPSDADPGL